MVSTLRMRATIAPRQWQSCIAVSSLTCWNSSTWYGQHGHTYCHTSELVRARISWYVCFGAQFGFGVQNPRISWTPLHGASRRLEVMGAGKNRAREGDTRGERALPLPSRVSLSRARSFLRPNKSKCLLRRLGVRGLPMFYSGLLNFNPSVPWFNLRTLFWPRETFSYGGPNNNGELQLFQLCAMFLRKFPFSKHYKLLVLIQAS